MQSGTWFWLVKIQILDRNEKFISLQLQFPGVSYCWIKYSLCNYLLTNKCFGRYHFWFSLITWEYYPKILVSYGAVRCSLITVCPPIIGWRWNMQETNDHTRWVFWYIIRTFSLTSWQKVMKKLKFSMLKQCAKRRVLYEN